MNELAKTFLNRIQTGLERKSVTTASRWAEKYRIMGMPFPGNWSFPHHPWLKGMHDSTAELNIGQKSAQMGYTETVLNLTFFKMDVQGVDCLYVLPSKTPDASDFSAARFDPALELSPHLTRMFSDVKNVGHKRAGTVNLYIRGSRSRGGLKSMPVGFIVLDELDEMTQEHVPLALERTGGQRSYQAWMISTPTIDNVGINKYFQTSTQEHFCFQCPCCSRYTELLFPDCLLITATDINDPRISESQMICKECKGTLHHEQKPEIFSTGLWVPTFADRDSRGFYVNQMYSSAKVGHPANFARSFLNAQSDLAAEQEFYNSKLGVPHIVDGARVTDVELDHAIGRATYTMTDPILPNRIYTMGADVGRFIHVEIDEWYLDPKANGIQLNINAQCKVRKITKVVNFEELDLLMRQYNIRFCVIDANPERRKATEFAHRFPGRVRCCFYGNSINGKEIHLNAEDPTLTVDRTSWIDLSLGRYHNASIMLPKDTPLEYRDHLKALVRIYEKDGNGNPVGKYVNAGDDHYAHARNYAEIALPLGVAGGRSYNISGGVM